MGGKAPLRENSYNSDIILFFPVVETNVQGGPVPRGGGDLNWGTHAKSCSSQRTLAVNSQPMYFEGWWGKPERGGRSGRCVVSWGLGYRVEKLPWEGLRYTQNRGRRVTMRGHEHLRQMTVVAVATLRRGSPGTISVTWELVEMQILGLTQAH